MKLCCIDNSHTWTLQTKSNQLTPALDLFPGRRCLCGTHVIVDPDPRNIRGDSFQVAKIGSISADVWAASNPHLVTW